MATNVELRGFPRARLGGAPDDHTERTIDLSGMPLVPHVSELRDQLKERQRQALLDSEARLIARKDANK